MEFCPKCGGMILPQKDGDDEDAPIENVQSVVMIHLKQTRLNIHLTKKQNLPTTL